MHKPIALILLNWNTPIHTANCISALQRYCDESIFDIIVVDNGSTDNSLQLLKTQFPGLVYIENNENLGFAEGNNRGLNYSVKNGYTYSLIINTDTLVENDLISCLLAHLDDHQEAAVVQPAIYWMHNKTKLWNGKGGFNKILGVTYSDRSLPGKEPIYKIAEWATGCCMLIRNSALSKSGLFNSKFFLYYEDVELSFRLRDHGYEIHYLPSCKMYHEAGVSAKVDVPKKEGFLNPIIHYYVSRNRIWFLRKYGNIIFWPVYVISSALYYTSLLIYFILRGRNEKARFLIKGYKRRGFNTKNLNLAFKYQ